MENEMGSVTGFQPGEECRLCEGKCCKSKGCSLSPEDMLSEMRLCAYQGNSASEIEAFLKDENGLYAIDYFTDAQGKCFFLRMKHKCFTFIGVDAYGECIMLSKEGCKMPFERRPRGGRLLQSSPDYNCRQQYTGEMMRRDWNPYQEVLSRIYAKYDQQFESDGTYDRCEEAAMERMRRERPKTQEV